ncbi:MAG TPA: hypothetical protein ENH12_04700 [Proteobacteria bacterium]|nr:hypothetical protein [Pseudomonadota bacterium]
MKKEKAKKKGWLAAIRESMTRTGGCCGPGETCGASARGKGKKAGKDTNTMVPGENVPKIRSPGTMAHRHALPEEFTQ